MELIKALQKNMQVAKIRKQDTLEDCILYLKKKIKQQDLHKLDFIKQNIGKRIVNVIRQFSKDEGIKHKSGERRLTALKEAITQGDCKVKGSYDC